MNVRQLAAVDMYGTRGTDRRRRVILVEFVAGALAAIAFGVWLVVASTSAVSTVIGAIALGIGLNYVPLAAYAIQFRRSDVLYREVVDIDVPNELRRYGAWQFWVFVPLALIVFDVRDRFRRRR